MRYLPRHCILYLFWGFVSVVSFTENDGGTLQGVAVLFRHGDRSPMDTWPNDPYYGNSTLWPDGYGQLNNKGKRRHFELGKWFRNRYDGFLPSRYNSSDIYVRSTDVDRTLMSAECNLAGLYSPQDDQVWDVDIGWQPVPVHTVTYDSDNVLAFGAPCPKHDLLEEQLKASDEIQEILNEHKDTLDAIGAASGYGDMDLRKVSKIFSTVTIYRGFNLTLPGWTEDYWPQIQELAAIKFKLHTYTPEMARLRTGLFFRYLVDYFRRVEGGEGTKFLMLSAHDDTIADVTNAMGTYMDAVPEFASSVLWEVRAGDDRVYVSVYFKNSTAFVQLKVYDCDLNCGLDDFEDVMASILVDDDQQWTDECQNN
ncbi:prostatic acid phosphatase-like [Cylas formicarius]|uniref:prostatic acid phosphatase-like n=1 Tax=Cylas formicarius TaxID=197179 RepID=UPI0029589D97|nr:prostatic acid phosphatase-like [Cylas formicarius]